MTNNDKIGAIVNHLNNNYVIKVIEAGIKPTEEMSFLLGKMKRLLQLIQLRTMMTQQDATDEHVEMVGKLSGELSVGIQAQLVEAGVIAG